jgi:hypothetical protein
MKIHTTHIAGLILTHEFFLGISSKKREPDGGFEVDGGGEIKVQK